MGVSSGLGALRADKNDGLERPNMGGVHLRGRRFKNLFDAPMTTQNQAQRALVEALREFSTSARFGFLKSLHVGPLLGEDSKTLGEFSTLTFEELVVLALEAPQELAHITPAQERVLTTVLYALSEGDEPRCDNEPVSGEGEPADEDASESSPAFNSVQCELDLRERLAKLRIHPQLPTVKDIQLKQFWDASCPAAPFEESFTIHQLMGMDLTVLSKKRSMTGARLVSMTRALDNALASLDGVPSPRTIIKSPSPADMPPVIQRPSVSKHHWCEEIDNVTPTEAALVETFVRGISDMQCHVTPFDEAFDEFCFTFSVTDFLSIVTGAPLSISCARDLARWIHSPVLATRLALLQSVLGSPGAHISALIDMVSGGYSSRAFYALGAVVCARALGACEVQVDGRVCEGVWSSNPALVPLVLQEARSKRKLPLPKALSSVCPNLDPFLHTWLCKVSKEAVTPVRVSKKGRKGRR